MPDPRPLDALHTIRDLIRWGASEFARAGLVFGHGTDNALDEAFHLVLWKLALPFDLPAVYLESRVTGGERDDVLALLEARVSTRKPAAYLTGEAWFAGLAFHVGPQVLVPRSPIGELIARGFAPWIAQPPARVLDLCAGSGCIGIACALAFEDAQVDLAEVDAEAIPVMERNIHRHGVEGRVSVASGDLFAPLRGRRYDLIVTNPPYVPMQEWQGLAAEYHHEPRHALEAGEDGMDVVARILGEAPDHLEEDGVLICEIGGSQAEFDARFPRIPVSWPDFEHGADGVFVIPRTDLLRWQESTAVKSPLRKRKGV